MFQNMFNPLSLLDIDIEYNQDIYSKYDEKLKYILKIKNHDNNNDYIKNNLIDYTIEIQLIGQILFHYNRDPIELINLTTNILNINKYITEENNEFIYNGEYNFNNNIDILYESYNGIKCSVKYCIEVKIIRNYLSDLIYNKPFIIQNYDLIEKKKKTKMIKMEVGIQDCLHIEFEYDNDILEINKGVILGKIYFILVHIKLKTMKLCLIQNEITRGYHGEILHKTSKVIDKYQIMDGTPVNGTSIPIRCYLKNYKDKLISTTNNSIYSIKYYLNLVLFDHENRRYFKQKELKLYRSKE